MDLTYLLVPPALVLWLATSPLTGRGWLWLQVLCVGLFLCGGLLAGLWLMPPRWYGLLVFAVFVLVAAWRLRLAYKTVPEPLTKWYEWPTRVVAIVLAIAGAWSSLEALTGRAVPGGQAVYLATPFSEGRYYIGHGGSSELINPHMAALEPGSDRWRAWRGQAFAIDFLGLGPNGLRKNGGSAADPESYVIHGTPLIAPCAGTVVRAEDGTPDNTVPKMNRDNLLGNHVILNCGGVHVVLAHIRNGTVSVSEGQSVGLGAPLGEVGNSGNSSEPHLHIHAQTPGTQAEPISGQPLPIRIKGLYLVRNDVFEP